MVLISALITLAILWFRTKLWRCCFKLHCGTVVGISKLGRRLGQNSSPKTIRHNITTASSATAVYHCTQESLKTTAFEFLFNVPLYQINVVDKSKFLWTSVFFVS